MEGTRRWYDIPFTHQESLLAEKEATLIANPTNSEPPLIDSLEVYGVSKVELKNREKKSKKSLTNSQKKVMSSTGSLTTIDLAVVDLPQFKTTLQVVLSLTFFFEANFESQAKSQLLETLPAYLTDPELVSIRTPLKKLLASLYPSPLEYYKVKDNLYLSHFYRLQL